MQNTFTETSLTWLLYPKYSYWPKNTEIIYQPFCEKQKQNLSYFILAFQRYTLYWYRRIMIAYIYIYFKIGYINGGSVLHIEDSAYT